jgi:hypothetical protein
MVIAALWAEHAAEAIRQRVGALREAEAELIWHLAGQARPDRFRADLRARSREAIVADLELAMHAIEPTVGPKPGSKDPPENHRVLRLIYELAVGEHRRLLLAPEAPPPQPMGELVALINYLGYQVARSRPTPAIEWSRVFTALDAIRSYLDESWFADVGRTDLELIRMELESLSAPEFDAAVSLLSDAELYRWFHELDGVRGGNLDPAEEATLFEMIAGRASPATLLRIALAEGGSRFVEITAAVRAAAPLETAMEFIELCAAGAVQSDQLLVASLAGLAALSEGSRRIVLTSLRGDGILDSLAAAATSFIEANSTNRTDPLIVEFFKGLLTAVGDGASAMADLTIVGLVDRHQFREAWSSLGRVVGLAVTNPAEFLAVVIDIDTMRRNPARWLGATTADVATIGIGKLARLGRLGRAARALADLLQRLGDAPILRAGRLQLEAGHLSDVIGHLNGAAAALDLRVLMAQLATVQATTAQLEAAVVELPSLPVARALELLDGAIAAVSAQISRLTGSAMSGPDGYQPGQHQTLPVDG